MDFSHVPKKIGRYEIIKEIGRGGMGVVYLGRDPFIDRMVAIKTTIKPPPNDPKHLETFQKKFFEEAKAAGKLVHPHIVSIYDATVEKGWCYLIMEYIDGHTLKAHCREDNLLPIDAIVGIAFQCAKAINYAHKNGVIHRDIKPGNIMISKERDAKISDFGIAAVDGRSNTPDSGSLAGSNYYISPEQLRDEPLTAQSDIFSLGVVMYELLTGKKPFVADTEMATIFKIANDAPEPLKNRRQDIPESLERIVYRALEKSPGDRYPSGMHLAGDLSASFDNLRSLDDEIDFEEKFNALKKLHFFKEFGSVELSEVLNAAQWLKYEDSSTIITEGEIENSFYIIVWGEVVVRKKGKHLAILRQGDCFGEMAYLGKTKRTASIVALGETILMKLNTSFIDLTSLNTQLSFYKVFSTTLIKRLLRTSTLLSES